MAVAHASSNGRLDLHDNADAPSHDHMHAAPSDATRALIARGRLLLETYQRQKTQSPEHTSSSLLDASADKESLLQLHTSSSNNDIDTSSTSAAIEPTPPRNVTTWSAFVAEQQHSAALLDTIDSQLCELDAVLRSSAFAERLLPLSRTIQHAVQQKRASDAALTQFTAAIGPPVVLTDSTSDASSPDLTADAAQCWLTQPSVQALVATECARLQQELDDAKRVIQDLQASSHNNRSSPATAATPAPGDSVPRPESVIDLSALCEDICAPPDDGDEHRIHDFATPLPPGWEMRATEAGAVFFVNRHTHVTTWHDPRDSIDSYDNDDHDSLSCSRDHHSASTSSLRIKIPSERKSADSYANTVTSSHGPLGQRGHGHRVTDDDDPDVQYFDVVFNERGPIGIHFQANDPDGGATVRRLLPGTAAIETGILRPFDQLVAVNQHPVDTASFRHVMILLQGGLRPLTLSFKRELSHARRRAAHARSSSSSSNRVVADLDEEVVLDATGDEDDGDESSRLDGTASRGPRSYIERRRSSRELLIPLRTSLSSGDSAALHDRWSHDDADDEHASQTAATPTATASHAPLRAVPEDESVADKIITNLFSLFWTPPEPAPAGDVQTV